MFFQTKYMVETAQIKLDKTKVLALSQFNGELTIKTYFNFKIITQQKTASTEK